MTPRDLATIASAVADELERRGPFLCADCWERDFGVTFWQEIEPAFLRDCEAMDEEA